MKKFRLFKALSIFAIAAAGAVAVGVGTKAPKVEGAEAAYEYDIYVDITSTSYSSVYCHNWGVSGTNWPGAQRNKVSDKLYGVNLNNSGNSKCIFNNGNGAQTGDLDVSLHRVYVMDSDTGGVWQDLDQYFPIASQSPSNNTMRIFVNNSDVSNWNSSEAVTRVRCWGSSSYSWAGGLYELSWFQNKETDGDGASGLWYGYADVPTDITAFAVVRCSKNSPRRVWNYAPEVSVSSSSAVAARIYKLQE